MNVASVGGARRLAGGVATYLVDLSDPFVDITKGVFFFPEGTVLCICVCIFFNDD